MLDDVEGWSGQTYYQRPALKPAPFNNWAVGAYVFIAGLSGTASILAALADLTRPPQSAGLIRRGRYVPLLAPTLGAGLLIWDLHTPQRFYNMFRVAKATSPMSIGTWILSGFTLASIASAGFQFLADRGRSRSGLRRAALAANLPAAALGAGMGTYTAALLASTSTPLWAAAPHALAVRFASASIAGGAATLAISEPEGPIRRALDAITALALATELAADRVQTAEYRRKGVSAALDGGWGLVEKAGATGLGAALPLGLYALSALRGGEGALSRVASMLTIGGSFLLRVSTMQAGDISAKDPAISFRFAQPDNLPRRKML